MCGINWLILLAERWASIFDFGYSQFADEFFLQTQQLMLFLWMFDFMRRVNYLEFCHDDSRSDLYGHGQRRVIARTLL